MLIPKTSEGCALSPLASSPPDIHPQILNGQPQQQESTTRTPSRGSCPGVREQGCPGSCISNTALAPPLRLLYSCQIVSASLISKGLQALITPGKSLVAKQRKACLKGPFVVRTFARIAAGTPPTSHQPKLGSRTSPSDLLSLCFQKTSI